MYRVLSIVLAVVGIIIFGYGLLMIYESLFKDFETALISVAIGVIVLFAALYIWTKPTK